MTVINRHSNSIETSVSDLVYQLSRRFETGPTCDQDGHCHDAPAQAPPEWHTATNPRRSCMRSFVRSRGGYGFDASLVLGIFGCLWMKSARRHAGLEVDRDSRMALSRVCQSSAEVPAWNGCRERGGGAAPGSGGAV